MPLTITISGVNKITPQLYKYNDEIDEKREERNRWVIDKNKKEIVSYLTKKYNITI